MSPLNDPLDRWPAAAPTPVDGVDLRPALRRRLARERGPARGSGWPFRLAAATLVLAAVWLGGRLGDRSPTAVAGDFRILAGTVLWPDAASPLDVLVPADGTGGRDGGMVTGDTTGREVAP